MDGEMRHCPGCHGHVYDETDRLDSCCDHGMDDDLPDCTGCGHEAEVAALQAEVSHMQHLAAEVMGQFCSALKINAPGGDAVANWQTVADEVARCRWQRDTAQEEVWRLESANALLHTERIGCTDENATLRARLALAERVEHGKADG